MFVRRVQGQSARPAPESFGKRPEKVKSLSNIRLLPRPDSNQLVRVEFAFAPLECLVESLVWKPYKDTKAF